MCSCRSREVRSTAPPRPLTSATRAEPEDETAAAAGSFNFGICVGLGAFAGRSTRSGQRRRLGRRWCRSLRASTTSTASTAAIAIARAGPEAALPRRRSGPIGLASWRLIGHARRWGARSCRLDAVADVVGNRFGKFGLKRRRLLVLAPAFRLLFAPLRTVAHPSAHIALVTRLGGWRQCLRPIPATAKTTPM